MPLAEVSELIQKLSKDEDVDFGLDGTGMRLKFMTDSTQEVVKIVLNDIDVEYERSLDLEQQIRDHFVFLNELQRVVGVNRDRILRPPKRMSLVDRLCRRKRSSLSSFERWEKTEGMSLFVETLMRMSREFMNMQKVILEAVEHDDCKGVLGDLNEFLNLVNSIIEQLDEYMLLVKEELNIDSSRLKQAGLIELH